MANFSGGFMALGWVDGTEPDSTRQVWMSPDGLTWQRGRNATGTLGAFTYGYLATSDDSALVGGRTAAGETMLWESTDGTGWTEVPTVAAIRSTTLEGVVSDGATFLAFGQADGAGVVWRRAHAGDWVFAGAPPDSVTIMRVVSGPGGLVAVGDASGQPELANSAWWSADGASWQKVSMPPLPSGPSDRVIRLLSTDSGYLAIWHIGVDPTVGAARSADGRTWQYLDVVGLPPGTVIEHIDVMGPTLVALGRNAAGALVAFSAALPD